jgi:type I restriction enzyme S subunit
MSNPNGLPKHWRIVKVKEIASSIQYGYTESSSTENVGPKFLRITDIQDNKVDWKSVPYCKIADDAKSKYQLQDGDLVFARTGATVGKSFLIKGEVPDAVFASYLIRLRFPKEVSDKFVYNFFQSHLYWTQIVEGQVGIGQPNVNGTKLGQLLLPLPPLAEQQRIVAKLEELFSELDAGLASLKTAAQQLKNYRQAVLKWAFEGKLTNEQVKEGELPTGWKWVRVSEIAEVRLGRQRSPQKAFGENMCQYLRAANVTWDGLDLSDVKSMDFSPKEQEIYQLQKGDILLSEASGSVSEVGKPAIWNGQIPTCCFQNTLIRVRPGDKASSKFLHLRFYFDAKVENFRKIARGVGIHHLGAAGLSNWSFALPPLEEQHRVVQEIESRLSVCDKLEETIAASLGQAEALRQSILKKAFEGKLVPPILNLDGAQA